MIWATRKKLSRWPVVLSFFVLCGIMAIGMGSVILLAFTEGYTKGNLSSYEQGKLDGYAAACTQVLTQTRWAINTEADLVQSKKDTPQTGAKVKLSNAATQHFVCNRTVAQKTQNIYEP